MPGAIGRRYCEKFDVFYQCQVKRIGKWRIVAEHSFVFDSDVGKCL